MQNAAERCCVQMGVGEGFMHLAAFWSEGSVTDMGPCRGQYKGYNGISPSPGSVSMVLFPCVPLHSVLNPTSLSGPGHRSRLGLDGKESVRNGRGNQREPIQARPA